MGAYQVGKLLFDMKHDRGLAEEFGKHPEAVMERYGFTDEEKGAIRKKDVRFIYRLGVNPYLVLGWGGSLGLGRVEYLERLADAGPHPTERTTSYPGPSPEVREMASRIFSGKPSGSYGSLEPRSGDG